MGIPDYDISIEEMYEYNPRYSTVTCDNCGERISTRQVHTMQSFDCPDTELIICENCYQQMMKKEKENE